MLIRRQYKKISFCCKEQKQNIWNFVKQGSQKWRGINVIPNYEKQCEHRVTWFEFLMPMKKAHLILSKDLKLLCKGLDIQIGFSFILNDIRWNINEMNNRVLYKGDSFTIAVMKRMEAHILQIQKSNKVEPCAQSSPSWRATTNFSSPPNTELNDELRKLCQILIEILETRMKYIEWINESRKRFMLFVITILGTTHIFSDLGGETWLEAIRNIL
jgi:hypothetical protein